VPEANPVSVAPQLLLKVQSRVAGALRVVFVRDRGSEQRDDPVAGVLVDRALEAVHAVGEYLEEAVQDLMPLFGIDLLGRSIEPFTSAKRTVTCLRSPSRAERAVKIFSARCFGV
jgi:hypothetical protein